MIYIVPIIVVIDFNYSGIFENILKFLPLSVILLN